jgi:hypothetical protein
MAQNLSFLIYISFIQIKILLKVVLNTITLSFFNLHVMKRQIHQFQHYSLVEDNVYTCGSLNTMYN